jgi:hypothetical protein
LKLKEDTCTIDGESHSKLVKEDEVKKKHKRFEISHSKSNMLDRNFETRITRSQSNLLNYALMKRVMKMDEPQTYLEASRKKEWNEAMEPELNSLVRNDTWDLVYLPKGKELIGTKRVYKTKYKLDGTIDKYKARLIEKGYAQREGIDYTKTFSPVEDMDTIRMVLALVA